MTAIGIVAHVLRVDMVEWLVEEVRPDVIEIDDGKLGGYANHRRVWREVAARGGDWTVVLEDDCVPVQGFGDQLKQALAVAPCPIVGLYLGRARPPQWQLKIRDALNKAKPDTCFLTGPHLINAVGTAIKTPLVGDMLSTVNYGPIDEAITQWMIARGHWVAYTAPSLVEHRDTPTVIPQRRDHQQRVPGTRVAWNVGTRDSWTPESVML